MMGGRVMKRMLCLISDQVLPNFIAVNEPATRPDVLYGMFTPSEPRMEQNWKNLKMVLGRNFSNLKLNDFPINDAYDAQDILQKCQDLIASENDDEWALNATGGTKLMSAAASEAFFRNGWDVYYVESFRNRTLRVSPDWATKKIGFKKTIDVVTYFQLYGREVEPGSPRNDHEAKLLKRLRQLEGEYWPDVKLKHQGADLNEYDVIGIRYYQCYAFECKRVSDWRGEEKVKNDILIDLLKLYQMQQHFGGPFGKSYWVFSGDRKLTEIEKERARLFKVGLIEGDEINTIAQDPNKFGLPPKRQ
jgi:hypothetical protein